MRAARMSTAPATVLAGQGKWCKAFADGLARHAGLNVAVVPFDSVRDAMSVGSWRAVRNADLVVRVGFRPGSPTWRGRAFDELFSLLAGRPGAARTAYLWIGTDVSDTLRDHAAGRLTHRWRRAAEQSAHLALTDDLAAELASVGVTARVVGYSPPALATEGPLELLPDRFSALTYIPDSRPHFYGGAQIAEAARALPEVEFNVLAGSGGWLEGAPPNLHFLGRQESAARWMGQSSCLVRIVEHDGAGSMVAEMLSRGRHAIYSRPHEHTTFVAFSDTPGLIAALATLRDRHAAGTLLPDIEAAAWARAYFDPQTRFAALAEALQALASSARNHGGAG